MEHPLRVPLPGYLYESTTPITTPEASYVTGTEWAMIHQTHENPHGRWEPKPYWVCRVEGKHSVWSSIPYCLQERMLSYVGWVPIIVKPTAIVHRMFGVNEAHLVRSDAGLFEFSLHRLADWRRACVKYNIGPKFTCAADEILTKEDGRLAFNYISTGVGMEVQHFLPLVSDLG